MEPAADPILPPPSARLALGLLLTALAGMLDAVSYDRMDHLFLSFMSGNSVHLAVSLAGLAIPAAGLALAVVGCFLAGAICGDRLGTAVRPGDRVAALLGLQAGVMLAAAGAARAGSTETGLALVALALGSQNVVTLPYRGVALGRTYLSGGLVQLAQCLGSAGRGAGGPATAIVLLAAWASFVLGAVAGTLLASVDLPALLLCVAVTLGALSLWTRRLAPVGGGSSLQPSPTTRDQRS